MATFGCRIAESRRLIIGALTVLMIFSAVLYAQSERYVISRDDERVVIAFSEQWAFDEVRLPVSAPQLWGSPALCRAASVEAAGRHFVASAKENEQHLVFRLNGLATDSLIITPLIQHNSDNYELFSYIEFSAVPAKMRQIENRLSSLAGRVSEFHRQHGCFSCHTALPLALACKSAANRGYRIDAEKFLALGREISRMQRHDGSYFFQGQPDYGKIMTTLCAGTILALLSDFSSEFLVNLKKIVPLLPDWLDKDGLLKSDFFFRPLFIGQPSAALLEAFISHTLYIKTAGNPDEPPDDKLRRRVLQLGRWTKTQSSEAIHRRIILMIGTPFLFQFSHHEKPEIIRQLRHLLKNEPEGTRHDMRALARFLLNRLIPGEEIETQATPAVQTLSDEIWQCFEEIITFKPQKF